MSGQLAHFDKAKQERTRERGWYYTVFQRSQGKCEVCAIFAPWILEVHHIHPLRSGGHGFPDNLIALCPNCHAIVEKSKTQMAEHPRFEGWIIDTYGEAIFEKLCELSRQKWEFEKQEGANQ